MASSDIQLEAGKRLARDLRAIRRSHAVDIKEVLDATRLPDDVIEQMEETALMGNPMFNRVYLRSMFSSYASVLRVSVPDMMQALEEAMTGEYVGSLAQKYLGEAGPVETEIVKPAVKDEDAIPEEADLAINLGTSEKKEDLDEIEPEVESDTSPAKSVSGPKRVTPQSESVVDSGVSSHPAKKTVLLPNMSGFLMVGFAGVALIALIWFAVSWVLNTESPDDDVATGGDSSQVTSFERPERIVLPDSIQIELIASVEALDPIRVKIDRDLRRPFWIEHLDRKTFEMMERVEFERELENAQILMEGYVIPPGWYVTATRAEISRTQVQAWLDSLTQAGVYPPRQVGNE